MTTKTLSGAIAFTLALVAHSAMAQTVLQSDPQAQPQQADDQPSSGPAAPVDHDNTMLRAQILLDRVHFSPGEIDGAYGSNTGNAIAGFQRRHDLEATGKLDDATWAALNTDVEPVLFTYTISAADIESSYSEIPSDMMAKAELSRLGYQSPVEALGEQFHASPALLQRLNPGKDLGAVGTQIVVPNVNAIDATPLTEAAQIIVDKSDSTLLLADAQGKVYAQFPATTGSEHDPLPLGEWKIKGVAMNPTFHYNPKLFWDADPSHAKATIPPGPNNPVGVVWIDLSKPHYGIHGTPVPSTVGKTESHGCIRLTNWSALQVAEAVAPGTQALLRE